MSKALFNSPSVLTVVFSVKSFAGAILALWVAFYFDLTSPYWAMATAYVVAHPLSGSLTSKAVYRLIGTIIGAIAAVVLVPNLVNVPVFLTAAVAIWTGVCLVISLYDRTPRSYLFMLAGYTTAIIAFPIVDQPQEAFNFAVARSQEICLGILCAAAVNRLVFPRDTGPVLGSSVDAWLTSVTDLARQALGPGEDLVQSGKMRQKLAADAITMRDLTAQIAYDASTGENTVQAMRALQLRMVEMLPLISSIGDLMGYLMDEESKDEVAEAHPTIEYALHRMIDRIAAWLETKEEISPEGDSRLQRRLRQVKDAVGPSTYRYDILALNLAQDLYDFVQIRSECLALYGKIVSGRLEKGKSYGLETFSEPLMVHYDHGMAFLSGLAVVIAICIAVAFWRFTAWPYGAFAATMASIFCCLFARADDPAPLIAKQCGLLFIVFLIAFVVNFAVMPLVDGFIPLALMLALLLIPLGTLIASPATAGVGVTMCVNLPYMLLLQSHLTVDFTDFVNTNLAMVTGVYLAACVTMLMRSVGAEWSARRLLRAGWGDIAELADTTADHDRVDVQLMLFRMIDRFGLLTPRLAVIPATSEVAHSDILRDLRVGIYTARLKQAKTDLPRRERRAVGRVLRALHLYFGEKSRARQPDPDVMLRIFYLALRVISNESPLRATLQARLALIALHYVFQKSVVKSEPGTRSLSDLPVSGPPATVAV